MKIPHWSPRSLHETVFNVWLDYTSQKRESDLKVSPKSEFAPGLTGRKRARRKRHRGRIENKFVLSSATKRLVPDRSGVSLIEMMVVITILTLMISLTGMTFHLLLRTEKLVTQSFVIERSISQLAIQFRNDVHLSESGVVTSDSAAGTSELVLGSTNETKLRYVTSRAGLVRYQIDGERVVAREDYRLPECRLFLLSDPHADGSLRTLVIERPGAMIVQKNHQSGPLRSLRIDARLNRLSGNGAASPEKETQRNLDSTETQQ